MRKLLGILLVLPLTTFAASYFVTPSGAGNHNGASLANAWSVTDFNLSRTPMGGDTVTFSGSFTSTVTPATGGTGNGAGRLILDMTGAALNGASPRIQINVNYLTILGGTMGSSSSGDLITFNPGIQSHDVTINGWTYTGAANGTATFLLINHCYNLVVSNCAVDNVTGFIFGDSTQNHDILITGCYGRTSTDTTLEDDVIKIADAANITIEKCKLISRAPASPGKQHNDIIQTYTKGGTGAGSPTNWIIRYNWIEMQQTSGSGDNSWLMLEAMSGDPALKVYGNVFVGSGTVGNNGVACTRNHGGSYYCYNNTFVRHHNPDNTVRFLDSGTLYAKNNVGIEDAGISGTFLGWAMTEGAWDYNFWYGFNAPSQYFGAHGSTSILPAFTNYAGNDFSLLPSSPLRGKGDRSIGAEYNQGIATGSTWPNPTLVARSAWDIGAYESSATPSAPRNLHVVPAR